HVSYHLVRWRRRSFRRMPSSRASRRSSLFDPADLDWRWDSGLREARQRHRSPSDRRQSLQERHGGALLRGPRTSWRATERRPLTRRWSELLSGPCLHLKSSNHFHFGPHSLSVAVAHLFLVRPVIASKSRAFRRSEERRVGQECRS